MVNHKNEVIDSVWITFIVFWKALQTDVVQYLYIFRIFSIFRDKNNWILSTDCLATCQIEWRSEFGFRAWIRIQSHSCLIKAIVISRSNIRLTLIQPKIIMSAAPSMHCQWKRQKHIFTLIVVVVCALNCGTNKIKSNLFMYHFIIVGAGTSNDVDVVEPQPQFHHRFGPDI